MKYYHNPRCSKSRQGLALLKENGIEPTIVEYLKTPLTAPELEDLLAKLGMEPEDLMRKGEADFKEQVKGKALSRTELVEMMIAFPKLIERPIFVKGNKAVVGRPGERLLEI
ncbi:MAG: arsenate reductase [Sphingobacteriales bacterium]|jgi:arsenate reductase